MIPIPRLCIVGVGLIGGSIGLAAKVRGAADHVVGVEPDADNWVDALKIGAVDEITNDIELGVRDADLVILAVPVEAIRQLLPRLAPILKPGAVVTDTGSVKEIIVKAAEGVDSLSFVGSHPMAGSEKGGAVHSRADMFGNATWVIVPPTNSASDSAVEYVAGFVSALGAKPLLLSAAAHDEIVALTSHLPHILAYTLCAILGDRSSADRERFLALAAGSWRSTTRVAESSPELWSEIVSQNVTAIAPLLRTFASKLNRIASALESGDTDSVKQHFTDGNLAKIEE